MRFTQMRMFFLFSTWTFFFCLNSFFLTNTDAQVSDGPAIASADENYTFETIEVPGVDFLALTASSDSEGYAGYTKSADGTKDVAFTFIDGVFMTYDFPGSQNTYFFALGNNGTAAGHYEDSAGLYHGVFLDENGELKQYDFPGAVETFISGITDGTGALFGNYIDVAGVRRGFSGKSVVEFPGASATYVDFVGIEDVITGSYVDADGIYHLYLRSGTGQFIDIGAQSNPTLEYVHIHDFSAAAFIMRSKFVNDVPRTYVVSPEDEVHELRFPDSVSTEGWHIHQDGSVVGYYDTVDGRRHGFIARLAEPLTFPDIAIASHYTYQSIDVPGVDFLALTASSDFEDYAGNTLGPDGEKIVGFTLIDGVFTTYDFPGSQNTYFYALGNDGTAAGHYEDSEGLSHGIILEDGELRQYDFPGAVQTEIYGISDATGALTGNYIDVAGVQRGFSGDIIVEFPGASATYAYFVNVVGTLVGSYVDAEGAYHLYLRNSEGQFIPFDVHANIAASEYFLPQGINDAGDSVIRAKALEDVPRTYVATLQHGLHELRFPDSVSTEGWNINQDGSVVGYYDTVDGRRHGFIARLAEDTVPEVSTETVVSSVASHYTYESIDVPGVDFLALTASTDFEDYAGYTKSADGEKIVGFTFIDGVFTTYDFPGSRNTYFYALGNNGNVAGHYEDSEGRHRGIVLEAGELREYNFPGAVETEIYGISDATGALTGNFIDVSGVRRGFSGEAIIEFPGASATYADFVSSVGNLVGSYVDAEGIYHTYLRAPNGSFSSFSLPNTAGLDYFFLHGISDTGVAVARGKAVGDVPRTYVGVSNRELYEIHFPSSVSTEGWNINQDGSVVGHYDTLDGRRHGFIARPANKVRSDYFANVYDITLSKGLNMLSVPLAPPNPMTAKSLVALTGATTIITLDTASQRFVAWTPSAPDDGFPIEGGKGYIVNVPEARTFAFVGAPWRDPTEAAAAAPALSTDMPQEAWAFVVNGHLKGNQPAFDGYTVNVRNLRTNNVITTSVIGDYFAAATADLGRRSVVQAGDLVEVRVIGPDGNFESQPLRFKVTPEHLANAVSSVRLDGIGQPTQDRLLQNYPNPFNPETWIPYQLSEDSQVSVSIYDTTGQLVRTFPIGFQSAGFYNSRERAAYWDGRNALGERVASGIYFYQLTTSAFHQTRRMLILK